MRMQEPNSPRQFVRVPNLHTAQLIESYCPGCGMFIAAGTRTELIEVAERAHACRAQRPSSGGEPGGAAD